MSELLHVSSAPHVRAKTSTSNVMLWVIIALLPTTCFGIYNFGIRALILLVATVLSCVLSETVFNLILKKKNTIGDLSAVVTGMILALNMPVTLPIWEAVLGGAFAIIVVKMLFGGLGQNFMNPALAARCFLLIAFAGDMSNFKTTTAGFAGNIYSGATPLAQIRAQAGVIFKFALPNKFTVESFGDAFLGFTGGTIGETSVLCLLIGLVILVAAKVVSLRIPLAYLGSFAVFMFFFGKRSFSIAQIMAGGVDVAELASNAGLYVVAQLLTGGIVFGAIFMATDYATTPITKKGQILFGIVCGLLTGIFRTFGGSAEGVSYAIILANLMVPLIEKITIPRAFGLPKKALAKKEVK